MTISIAIYCLAYTTLAYVGGIGILKYLKKEKSNNSTISLAEITVVIPFRNEENRILPLLESFNQSRELPFSIIFVDDHSTDKTVEMIQNHLKIPHQLIPATQHGKKRAIACGIEKSETSYILTMDADVWFEEVYFSNLQTLPPADMHILPVRMNAKGWKTLFELDVYIINGINLIINELRHSIVASGANLLFLKSAYIQTNSLASHEHIASGDDQFLLADFVRHNKNIQLHCDAKYAVTTEVPRTLKEFVSQRLRWILKTPNVNDSLAMKIGAIQLVATISFLILGIGAIVSNSLLLFLVLFSVKTLIDAFLVSVYFSKIGKINRLILLPLYEISLPVYTIFLAFISLVYKPKWKGR